MSVAYFAIAVAAAVLLILLWVRTARSSGKREGEANVDTKHLEEGLKASEEFQDAMAEPLAGSGRLAWLRYKRVPKESDTD